MGIDGVRSAFVVAALVTSCVQNPPPPYQQQYPQQQPYGAPYGQQPYGQQGQAPYGQPSTDPNAQPASQASAQYTPCEYACGQMSRCQIAPYDPCVGECRSTTARRGIAENDPAMRAKLYAMASESCESLRAELAASGNASAQPPYTQPAQPPYTQPAQPPYTQPAQPPYTPPAQSSSAVAGHWVSAPHASYTNAAYVSADFFLDITIASDGSFRGSWARYICAGAAYAGVLSCGRGNIDGSASGSLDANGTGWIELERVGKTSLVWTSASGGLQLDLPTGWQGDKILIRSKLKR